MEERYKVLFSSVPYTAMRIRGTAGWTPIVNRDNVEE